MLKRLIRRRRERVIAFVAPHAMPSEHPLVVLPTLMQGVHPGLVGAVPVVVLVVVLVMTTSFLLAITVELAALALVVPFVHARALLLTETRVFMLRCNPLFLQPTRIESAGPRSDVRVAALHPNALWGQIVLRSPDGDRRCWFHRIFRSEATALYAALGPARIEQPLTTGVLPPPIV